MKWINFLKDTICQDSHIKKEVTWIKCMSIKDIESNNLQNRQFQAQIDSMLNSIKHLRSKL